MYETDPTSQVTPQSLSRKEREFARREKDILDAAMRLFDCAHWEEITVEQIAKEAEVGKGTVYKHFPSKEALYAQISLEFHESLLNTFYEVEQKATDTENIQNYHPALLSLLFEPSGTSTRQLLLQAL